MYFYTTIPKRILLSKESKLSIWVSVETFFKEHFNRKKRNIRIKLFCRTDSVLNFPDPVDRDWQWMTWLIKKINNMNNTVTSDIKSFIKEHRQIIIGLYFNLLLTTYFWNGQLTTKINIIQSLLNKTESLLLVSQRHNWNPLIYHKRLDTKFNLFKILVGMFLELIIRWDCYTSYGCSYHRGVDCSCTLWQKN
jgi:hypothetical protein